jgi:phosphoribosylglycinamide formyltransferase-1
MADSPLVIGVLASGRGSNLQSILNAIQSGALKARVGVVVSDKRDAEALVKARAHHLPAFFLDPRAYPDREGYDEAVVQTLSAHQVELVVLAGFMRLVTKKFLDPFQNKVINIHPSLLPAFPGLNAHRQALTHGVKVSGCTVHFVDSEMDHGPIIAQVCVPVLEGDTESSLADRILAEEHRVLPRVIQYYADGKIKCEGRKVLIEDGLSI